MSAQRSALELKTGAGFVYGLTLGAYLKPKPRRYGTGISIAAGLLQWQIT
jgi:hypothetical protein